MKKARILQVIPELHGGGAEAEALLMAQAIQEAGGQAYIASQGGQLVPLLEAQGARHITLPVASKNPYQMWRNVRLLKEVVQIHNIHLLHVRSRAPAWSVAACAKQLRLPWVTTYHNGYRSTNALKHTYNSVMARADRVIAISAYIESLIHQTYNFHNWFSATKVRLVPRGIDLERFAASAVSADTLQALRAELQLPASHPVILLPGRFSKRKGQRLLLQVFSELVLQGYKGTLLLLGQVSQEDPYSLSLKQEAEKLGIQQIVRFLPYRPDVRPFYALADIVVVPSLTPEGFGRVTAEAAAFQKVVIGSAHGATPEILVSEKTGFLVEPNNLVSLRETLQQALSLPPEQAQLMGERARSHIETHFSKQQFFEKTLHVYEELLSNPPLC